MQDYTVVFKHPGDQTLGSIHICNVNIRHAHMAFLGELANEWGFGWDDICFGEETDLSQSHGTIMIGDKPLHYDILPGHQEPGGELATLT